MDVSRDGGKTMHNQSLKKSLITLLYKKSLIKLVYKKSLIALVYKKSLITLVYKNKIHVFNIALADSCYQFLAVTLISV
jgi:hypothetical protein